ncbi:DUF418 domain-containing protein [Bacillus sp. T33-2]|uniref:DUF418 domain-containing protein n=1 Tax=Bacillus sp. T33-2 TaxID=2054168 RepID=UPI00215513C5|nr:DUF418 domain-containing protein [Bacillus sp. T33-2]
MVGDALTDQNRIVSIDMMRGAAILGIFLVNMMFFHSPFLYIEPLEWWPGPLNRITYIVIDIFLQASFYPLFAMLFGYGLVILRDRMLMRNQNFTILAVRRLSLLLLIGVIHAFLVWHGDILITYAVCGFVFLLFMRLSANGLLYSGLLVYLIPNILLVALLTASIFFSPGEALQLADSEAARASMSAYQTGSFSDITRARFREWYEVNGFFIIYFFTILPLFFIGAGAAKKKWFENIAPFRKSMAVVGTVLFIAGLVIKLLPYVAAGNVATDYAQDFLGGPMLAASYGIFIALLARRHRARTVLLPLAAVGRLSISNYLFQSVLCTLIFYNYGLGLYGKVSIFTGTMLAIVFFGIQVAASRWWVSRYYYGPVEWLWRAVTYMRRPKWKRSRLQKQTWGDKKGF